MSDQANPSNLPYDISSIDQATLTPIVRQALNNERAVISDWNSDRVYGGAGEVEGVLSGVYRFTGTALDRDSVTIWSLILKVIGTTGTQDDPPEPRYWKRELLAYQSGQLAKLPGKLFAPNFFGVHEFSEKVVGLWLEYIEDDLVTDWSLDHYGFVARHLGQFNGTFLVKQELPNWTWLSRDWLRKQVGADYAIFIINKLRQSLDKHDLNRWFIGDDPNKILQLWEERELFLDVLDQLPQTILHYDAFRRNLFLRHDTTVAVDWTFVGVAAIGQELVSLVNATLSFTEVKFENARELDQVAFEAYLLGLADSGWSGDSRLARLGYTAGSAMLWGLAWFGFDPPAEYIPWMEQTYGLPIDELHILNANLIHYVLELADEARQLMADLQII